MNITEKIHPEIAEVCLSEEERRALEGIANDLYGELEGLPEHKAVDNMLDAGEAAAEDFPALYEALGELMSHESWKTMVIHGPKPDGNRLSPTPVDYLSPGENPLLKEDIYRGMILGMMGVYPYGYDSQQPGNIHNNVIPIKGEKRTGISANFDRELGLHTEDASYNLDEYNISPDWLTIHALRNPHIVPSLVSVPDLSELSKEARAALGEEFFVNHTNPGQGGDINNAHRPVAVLYGPQGEWIRLNTEELDARGSEYHEAALDELVNLAVVSTVRLDFLPGDIVINDNRRVLHGRAQPKPHQEPNFKGYDRWQRRVVAADNPARIQKFETAPRIVSPQAMLTQAA